ncbi:ABC transporter permease [Oceanivirga salmonicida]|uniref:ABC transporter permease n=1 Tax=Oceanivirga salmonicida TaxID=1769291 RepID=UPI0012E2DEAB|nr:iron ABC transporter permease [Oceanivirga salmonicida]
MFKRAVVSVRRSFSDPILLITILFSIFTVCFFILIPLWNILLESLTNNGINFGNYIDSFTMSGNVRIIINTIKLGVTTGIISLIIGFIFAYINVYIKIRFKKMFDFIALLPIISPPFVVALSAILLFGRNGIITKGFLGIDYDIYGFHGLVIVQVLSFFPIAYLMLVGLLSNIDPSVEEASRSLGANRFKVFTTVTLPLMAPGLANAFLLVFIQSIADYANPFVIGGKFTTIAVKIFQEGVGNYQLGLASALSMVLLSISISMFALQRYYINSKSYITVTGKASRERDVIKDKRIVVVATTIISILSLCVIGMYILIPISSFTKLFGIDNSISLYNYKEIWKFTNRLAPIITTTTLAVIATFFASVFSMIIAFLIVRKKFIGKSLIEFTVMMGLAIPGTIIGIGFALSYNKIYNIPFTSIKLIPTLTGTAFIIIMAFIIRSLPVGVRSGVAALNQIDPSIEEASTILGANSATTFIRVTLPMIREAFLTGLIYSFARSMTLVSTVVFLISAKWKLLTPIIMDNVDQGRIGIASAYCTILILIVSVFMMFVKVMIFLMKPREK